MSMLASKAMVQKSALIGSGHNAFEVTTRVVTQIRVMQKTPTIMELLTMAKTILLVIVMVIAS